MLKKRDVIEAKLKVWGDKKACAFGTTLLRKQNSPRHIIFRNSMQNIIFLPLEKVFKIKPACVKSWFQKSWKKSFFSRNPGKKSFFFQKSWKKKFFFQKSWKKNILVMQRFWKIKKGGKRSFINWNEHRETKNERIGTKTVLRVKKILM